jgi:hypothetical protein
MPWLIFSDGMDMEAGYNTSIVPLQIVEGDEKGIQCLGV